MLLFVVLVSAVVDVPVDVTRVQLLNNKNAEISPGDFNRIILQFRNCSDFSVNVLTEPKLEKPAVLVTSDVSIFNTIKDTFLLELGFTMHHDIHFRHCGSICWSTGDLKLSRTTPLTKHCPTATGDIWSV